jgi:hypothetical protein
VYLKMPPFAALALQSLVSWEKSVSGHVTLTPLAPSHAAATGLKNLATVSVVLFRFVVHVGL